MIDVSRLIHGWVEEAESLRRRHGDEGGFSLISSIAQDLEKFLDVVGRETLDLQEAGEESGFSEEKLWGLISDGTIPNAGCGAYPGIARRNLPRKPGFRVVDVGGIRCHSEVELTRQLSEPLN